jgi:hypothetical protein
MITQKIQYDLRVLNAATIPEPFPMASNTIAKENCKQSRYFCVSDLADAFFSVKLREKDYGKTGFTTHSQQYVFKVMPQGAMNAERQFSRIATAAFDGVPLTVICPFQDDTLNHAKTFYVSLVNQQLLYDRTRKRQLILKQSKTSLGYSTAKFLGHIYSQQGRTPDPALVSAVLDLAVPTTLTQLKSFIGLVLYNIDYMRGGNGMLAPLNDLTQKGKDVERDWDTAVHGIAFNEIKHALTTAPCLIPIDPQGKFTIHVDTCKTERGIGAVLLQYVEKLECWRPCAYYSKKLKVGQKQWSATELEAIGLVYACIHWEKFLRNGLRFTVIVDHKALLWLVTRKTKTANGRIITWILQLQDMDFDILHRNGVTHLDADAISRLLHFDDIAATHEMAREANIDDLTGPANEQDLHHLIQMMQLDKFFKARAINKLRDEVDDKVPEKIIDESVSDNIINSESKQVKDIVDNTKINSVTITESLSKLRSEHTLLIETTRVLIKEFKDDQGQQVLNSFLHAQDCPSDLEEDDYNDDDIWIDELLYDPRIDLLHKPINMSHVLLCGNSPLQSSRADRSSARQTVAERNINLGLTEETQAAQALFKERQRKSSEEKKERQRNEVINKSNNNDTISVKAMNEEDQIEELIEPFLYLENQCYIDPRNRRLYEVVMVTYDEKLKIIAAFRRVTDNEPPEAK